MIFKSISQSTLTLELVLLCSLVSLLMGVLIAITYMYKNSYTKNFVVSLTLLPVLIQVVIMMVNGNLGTSVAVLGTFSLIRFRSIAGSARDIVSVFFAMAVGLACGMGFLGFALLITLVISAMSFMLNLMPFGDLPYDTKDLRIVVPEALEYEGIFDDIFDAFTTDSELIKVKTTNMGSLFELHYRIKLRKDSTTKPLIDAIRIRNGNLSIVCGRPNNQREEL